MFLFLSPHVAGFARSLPFLQFLLARRLWRLRLCRLCRMCRLCRLWRLRCGEDSDSFSALYGFRCCLRAGARYRDTRTYLLPTNWTSRASQSESDSPPPGESLGCKHRDIDPTEKDGRRKNLEGRMQNTFSRCLLLLLSLSPGSVAWNSNGFMDTSFCVPSYHQQWQSRCTEH